MGKYQFKNKYGEIIDIFKGKGFTGAYTDYKALPFLTYKNEWDSDEIRLRYLEEFPEFKETKFQLYVKQQRLEYLFGVKFKKEELLDKDFTVAFYEYQSYKNSYYYAVIPMMEFIKRYKAEIESQLEQEGISLEELEKALLKEHEDFEEEKKQARLRQKRINKIGQEIKEKRQEKNVYLIRKTSSGFYIERFTAASEKWDSFETKEEVEEFIKSNARGDSKRGFEVIVVDSDNRKDKLKLDL